MAKPLSKEAEQTVISAIQTICDSISAQPLTKEALQSAAVKVSQEHGFGPDMIRLMCAGYNTGATAWQRERHTDILKKHASFPLADADEIIAAVYPAASPEKSAAVQLSRSVDPVYAQPPRRYVPGDLPVMHKTASETIPLAKLAAAPTDPHKLLHQTKQLQDQIKEARTRARRAEEELLVQTSQLSQYFKQASRRWLFGEVKYAAAKRFGKAGQLVLQAVADLNGYTVGTELMPKQAVDWRQEPFTLVDQCVQLARQIDDLRDQHIKVAVENRIKIAQLLAPLKQPASAEPAAPRGILRQVKAAGPTSSAVNFAVISGALKNLAGDYLRPTTTSSLVQGKLDDLSDPEHEEELRRIRAQSMLQGFLTDDEVLSTHDPEKVMQSYNELNTLSPRVAQQPAGARSVLRRWMTQGGIEPFEAKEVTDLEKNLTQTQGRVPPRETGEKVSNVLTRHRGVLAP